MPDSPLRAAPDPFRVVCAGDAFFAPGGVSSALETLCRAQEPERPWRFRHAGEPGCRVERLRAEAVWKVLGPGGGRILVSLGEVELAAPSPDPRGFAREVGECLDLLADKAHGQVFLVLPVPGFWPLEKRPLVQAARQELSERPGAWRRIDLEPRAASHAAAQAAHPDTAAALCEADRAPTALGALLAALEIRAQWD